MDTVEPIQGLMPPNGAFIYPHDACVTEGVFTECISDMPSGARCDEGIAFCGSLFFGVIIHERISLKPR